MTPLLIILLNSQYTPKKTLFKQNDFFSRFFGNRKNTAALPGTPVFPAFFPFFPLKKTNSRLHFV